MRGRLVPAALAVAALAAGCMATVPAGEGGTAGAAPRVQQVNLHLGERVNFDGGALRITLTGVGADEATVLIEENAVTREARLRPGSGGSVTVPPYRIQLVSTSVANTATVEVVKER